MRSLEFGRTESLACLVREIAGVKHARGARRAVRAKVATLALAPLTMVVVVVSSAPRLALVLVRVVLEGRDARAKLAPLTLAERAVRMPLFRLTERLTISISYVIIRVGAAKGIGRRDN